MLGGVWVVLAGIAGVVAAGWLRQRRYRRDDDEVVRTLSPWWVPVGSVVATAAAVGTSAFAGFPVLVQATYLLALVWGVVLVVIDLEVLRLPDVLVLRAYPVVAVLLALGSLVTGDGAALLRASACAGAGVAFFLATALLSSRSQGLGLGDVKLAGVLGALLGWLGWSHAFLGLLGGFVLGGLAALVLLVLRRVDRSGSIPLGPAMLAAAYLTCVLPALA